MSELETYKLELQDHTYKVQSSGDALMVADVFNRLQEEIDKAKQNQAFLSEQEELIIASLNMAQRVLDLEEENRVLLELLGVE